MKGFIQRLLRECRYIRQGRWSYEDIARHWDDTIDYDKFNEAAYPYSRRFVDAFNLCNIPDNSYVLDICSRTGNGTLYFYRRGKVRSAVCADVSGRMQEVCRKRLAEQGVDFKTVFFQKLPLPFQDGEFDAVLCFETIEHMPKPARFMQELARVVNPKGEIVLTTPNVLWEMGHWFVAIFGLHHSEGPHRFIPRRWLLRFAREADLSLEKEKTTILIPFGPKWMSRLNEFLERILPEGILRIFALRRIFIFRRSATEQGG